MDKETLIPRIARVLHLHSVIQIPGITVNRAKCRCGWIAQGHKLIVEARVEDHQATEIANTLMGHEAELVEDDPQS